MLRTTPTGAFNTASPVRRSSATSITLYAKHGNNSRGSSVSGRPLINSVVPALRNASSASALAGSQAMKAGTSIIRLVDGLKRSTSASRPSLAMFSETRPPPAGQTSPTACSSCSARSGWSRRSGKTVSRGAVTARLRSMNGE